MPERASHERGVIDAILDEALVCHLGFVDDGSPVVTPTLHARIDDHVYFHGSAASRTLRTLRSGVSVCLTVTLVDGLVLARSAFHHSVNYRSVMVFGKAYALDDAQQKLRALEAFTEKLVSGRWPDVRPPTRKELKGTSVLRIALAEASAKIRTGPPADDEADYELDAWAGVLPLRLEQLSPEPDPRLPSEVPLPPYLSA